MDSKINFTFTTLKRENIQECSLLVARIFSLFDPFIFKLKISEEDLQKTIEEDFEAIVDDNLVIIAKDQDDKICGCYAGFRFTKILKRESTQAITSDLNQNSISFTLNENLSYDKKLAILEKIDNVLLKDKIILHNSKNELEQTIFCDYFCISDKYFSTNLAKELALNFFDHCMNNKILHIYGSFFNVKAIKLLTKYFPARIVKEIKVNFKEDDVMDEYDIYLLYGSSEEMKTKDSSLTPKF